MMPVITKGTGISGALRYALGEGNDLLTGQRKALQPGAQSRAEILGGQHFGFKIQTHDDVELARKVMEWQALPENQAGRTRKCEKDCLSYSLSWHKGYEPSREEMVEAAQNSLKALGMEGARAIFIAHSDTDHRHIHVIASRINPQTGMTFSDRMDRTILQRWALDWEREKGQITAAREELHALVDAVRARDVEGVIDGLTKRESVFTRNNLEKMMVYAGMDLKERDAFRDQVLAHQRVVPLRETASGPVTHYTTREILAAERALQRDARILAEDLTHAMGDARVNEMAEKYTLDPEQRAALAHAGGLAGFTMINGQAGTGKSRVLEAFRDGYEQNGADVHGMAWTNQVVADMQKGGYRNAKTVAAELYYQNGWQCAQGGTKQLTPDQHAEAEKSYQTYAQWMETHGRVDRQLSFESFVKDRQSKAERWNGNTVLVVDEAAMLSTPVLAGLAAKAREAGAKLALAFDTRQLGSIERGGMCEPLQNEHGAAVLTDVKRVKDRDQKKAFNAMHDRDFGAAMKVFEDQKSIHWSQNGAQAARALAEQYMADHAADPTKARFIFAYTNELVDSINQQMRAFGHHRKELGCDHVLKTAHGDQAFAVSDRIRFTANGAMGRTKQQGFINGYAGVVKEIEAVGGKHRLTVELDHEKGKDPHRVSFTVGADRKAGEFDGIKHGYAGTIYRGQGRTLDQTYLFHSRHWREASGYVALTRHRENVAIFASHEVAKDIGILAKQLQRAERKRAAHSYHIDVSTLRDATGPAPQNDKVFSYDPQIGSRFVEPETAKRQNAAQLTAEAGKKKGQIRGPAAAGMGKAANAKSRLAKTEHLRRDDGAKSRAAEAAKKARRARIIEKVIPQARSRLREAKQGARMGLEALGRGISSVVSGLASTFEGLFESREVREAKKAGQQAYAQVAPSRREIREEARKEQVAIDEAALAQARQEFLRKYGTEIVQVHERSRDQEQNHARGQERSR
jgi:AAA domain/Relaxase/Mobilisation nuclease domain